MADRNCPDCGGKGEVALLVSTVPCEKCVSRSIGCTPPERHYINDPTYYIWNRWFEPAVRVHGPDVLVGSGSETFTAVALEFSMDPTLRTASRKLRERLDEQ